jgi:SNF2 family DNA or RNA helicase
MTTLLFLANHLLLLDPAWNPAAEWQCFDRVHRLGQDKEVFIYKFITKVPESQVYLLLNLIAS